MYVFSCPVLNVKLFSNIALIQEVASILILLHILIPGNCMDQAVLDIHL